MKYDEKAVDALIEKATKHVELTVNVTPSKEAHDAYLALTDALVALRPKPEMEYVLREFKPDWRDLDAEPMMYVHASGETRSYSQSEWNYLREATRIPAKPKVRAGKDWNNDELWMIYQTFNSTSGWENATAAIIDLINSKQGGQ